ncbi:MAG: sulfotransferase [Candidatus Omnitrophica bacterium]|nr:sulfotransferase [Candidatus Omnitrophota bacterium]MBU1851564.1 sulfotransferase [Candidatus Omnitrophota bacterium]
MRYLHVASINRSGASLTTRLFDGHPDVASYPIEFNFPRNCEFYPFVDGLTGTPTHVPGFDPERDKDALKYFGISEEKERPVYEWGKERTDSVGVRENYLERELYNKVKTNFDYKKYISLLKKYAAGAKNVSDMYNARHRAYFEAWENNKYSGSLEYVATYGSGELYLNNFDRYFNEFPGSSVLTPVRDIMGYIASEKTRYARMYYGARRFSYPKLPNFFVKMFKQYDLDALIRSWLVAITRVVLLQERYGVDKRLIVYRYENLVEDTETTMRAICEKSGLRYDSCLLEPTIAHRPWGGSSHQGKQTGVNKDLVNYYPTVLTVAEIDKINRSCGKVLSYVHKIKDTPADFTVIPRDELYDYEYQKKYFDDEEKIALYSALAYNARRRTKVGPPDTTAIFALFFAKFVQLVHMPRLLKQRLFPGTGKQNYR